MRIYPRTFNKSWRAEHKKYGHSRTIPMQMWIVWRIQRRHKTGEKPNPVYGTCKCGEPTIGEY